MAKLTGKRWLFSLEYPKDFNATKAAKRAGYSPRTAAQTGHDLLKNPEVQKAITAAQVELKTRAQVEQLELIGGLLEIARARVTDFVDENGEITVDEKSPNVGAVSSVTTRKYTTKHGDEISFCKLKLRDPVPAIERIAKMTGLDAPTESNVNEKKTITYEVVYGDHPDAHRPELGADTRLREATPGQAKPARTENSRTEEDDEAVH